MKLFTLQKKVFTADLYDYTIMTDSSGTRTVHYSYVKPIVIDFINNEDSVRTKFYTDEVLRMNMKLTNIVDSNGNQLLEGGTYRITTLDPNINVFGKVDGYRYRAALANPVTFIQTTEEI